MLCLSLVVVTIDTTILNVALPTLVDSLHASSSGLQWIVDAYTVVFAGLLLTAGSLGDRFGRRGRAGGRARRVRGSRRPHPRSRSTPAQLIALRALTGVGAALVFPATLSILTNIFPDPRRAAAGHRDLGRAPRASASGSVRSPAACCCATSTGARCSG